jgi:rubrerythrin
MTTNEKGGLLQALRMAQAAEQKAAQLYADAAKKTSNPPARELFEKLAAFERHHYEKLVEQEKQLEAAGAFSEYEGRDLEVPSRGEVTEIEEPDRKSAMEVISMAMDIEQQAEERYEGLAGETSDADGKAMFRRLAEEEHGHYVALSDAYFSLSNRRGWDVSE